MREITCTNVTDNVSCVFNDTFSPFLLQDVDGIYTVDVNVFSTDNSLIDGATINGSLVKPRNIVITIADKENHGKHRNYLYSLFKPKTEGVFVYHEVDGDFEEKRTIDYVVEKVESETMGFTRQIVVSLFCADPFFSDMSDTIVHLSSWVGQFEFVHEFTSEKEELGVRQVNKLITIFNESSLENIGLTITMEAEGAVSNPKMYHFETDSYIQVGSSSIPFNMSLGDKLVISTVTNNKNVYLIRNGVKTIVNEYIEENSEYIQLVNGENTLRYSAASGEDNLLVQISYRNRYQGV